MKTKIQEHSDNISTLDKKGELFHIGLPGYGTQIRVKQLGTLSAVFTDEKVTLLGEFGHRPLVLIQPGDSQTFITRSLSGDVRKIKVRVTRK